MGRGKRYISFNALSLFASVAYNKCSFQLSLSTVFFGENVAQLFHLPSRQGKSFQIPRKTKILGREKLYQRKIEIGTVFNIFIDHIETNTYAKIVNVRK